MIIVKLRGGVGNQLFQYATGRRLALARGVDLKLDITWLGGTKLHTFRNYELGRFNTLQSFATKKEIKNYTQPNVTVLSRLCHRIFRKDILLPKSYIKESQYHFEPRILELPDGVYLDGYWQSERYFSDIAETLQKEIKITTPPEGQNANMKKKIQGCQGVSLHVRRGDYVKDPVVNNVHGICDLDYYRRAVTYIASKVSRPEFFVFSDDIAWVREHLKLPFPVHISAQNDAAHGFEDMRLMSLCRHHIIANSSFSWWGAWMNSRSDKIVVAPKKWFNNYDADTKDVCPAEWLRM